MPSKRVSSPGSGKRNTLVDHFQGVLLARPDAVTYRFLEDGEGTSASLTNSELDRQARAIAATLASRVPAGQRALIVCPPGLDYLKSFFACLYSGVIAVPVYPPDPALLKRTLPRLLGVIEDAEPAIVLAPGFIASMADQLAGFAPALGELAWHAVDEIDTAGAGNWKRPAISGRDIAFLQYTSGSTGQPKGVMVSHANLLDNLRVINQLFLGDDEDIRSVTWLPPYHDMGLIGGLLQPAYAGFPVTFMSPLAFLKRPARWLRAISDLRATGSGAPNFAYDLCVAKVTDAEREGLDLSSWRLAFTGAEPVRAETIDRFTREFEPYGFRRQAFYPCYGMAEATLLVSGGDRRAEPVARTLDTGALAAGRAADVSTGGAGRTIMGCGQSVPGHDVVIVDPESRIRLPEGMVGEIWVRGPSVAAGYWRAPEATAETFAGHLADGEGPFLRTGDLGFSDGGELYVTGRRKDLIIIAGRNHYPQDIELAVERSDPDLRPGCVIACSVDAGTEERLLIVAEVTGNPARLDTDRIMSSIRAAVAAGHDLQVHDIVLLRRGAIPKTSSGKLQRSACRDAFVAGGLEGAARWSWQAERSPRPEGGPPGQVVRADEISGWLRQEVARRGGVAPETVDPGQPVSLYGLKSVDLVGLVGDLEQWLGRELPATLVWEHPTIDALADFLAPESTATGSPGPAGQARQAGSGPVAIVGIGCRFPGGADSPESFWQSLRDGHDAITEVPADRWAVEDFLDDDPDAPGKTNTRWGGFVGGIDLFDPHFFGISPHEAARMDPQQRLLAETAWEALEDAGVPAERLAGSACGVFIGIATSDFARTRLADLDRVDAYTGTGNAHSIAANRLSYLFDLRGPSMAIDSACSSSLVAVHQACQSLARGECSLALAGGVNVILSPGLAISFSKAGAMAADGRCKAFDARADGYVRAEGAGVVVLKPLSQALADGDRIYGVILGGAVNQDGRTNGLMAPNPRAQEAVLRAAYADAGVPPGLAGYVEAHGTGTLLGDPIEAGALASVVGSGREPGQPCLIGSVKTNIGHLEAAAGIAGLIKVALMLRNREIPPSLHYQTPNPHIRFADLSLQVADALRPWPSVSGPAIAGVSSFGFGGTNAHLVLAGPPGAAPDGDAEPPGQPEPAGNPAELLTISARSAEALRELAARYEADLALPRAGLTPGGLAAATALRRTHHGHRLACTGSSLAELASALGAFARHEERAGLSSGPRCLGSRPRVAFVFAGQGPRWWPVGPDLISAHQVLRQALERCDVLLRQQEGWSLLEQLASGAESRLAEPEVAQPALCAVQIALAELWRSWGIEPSAVIGHSVGEIAAAHVAGALDLADALRVAARRGQVIGGAVGAAGSGGMAIVGLSLAQAREVLDRHEPGSVSIAASNGPVDTVLSGDTAVLDRIVAALEADGVFSRRLESVRFASHSPAMDPLSEELAGLLAGLRAGRETIPIFSSVTGQQIAGDELGAEYWAANLRQPVLFDLAITELAGSGHNGFVEVSPHPQLAEAIRGRLRLQDVPGVVVTSARREQSVRASLLSELGTLYTAGFPVDWRRVYGQVAPMTRLPAYPWQRERCGAGDATARARRTGRGEHPLLGTCLISAAEPKAHHWSAAADLTGLPYLRDHRVQGTAVLPATAMLDAALAAARQVLGGRDAELHDVTFTRVMPVEEHARTETLQLVIWPETTTAGAFRLFGRDGDEPAADGWVRLAEGGFRLAAPPDPGSADDADLLAAARDRCSRPLDRDAHYRRLRRAGLQYGPAFQGLADLRQAPGEAVARIVAPDAIAADGGPHLIHPALLDSCLQVLAAAMSDPEEDPSPGTWLPVAVRHCRIISRAGGPVVPAWVHACAASTGSGPDGLPGGRVVIFDAAGGRLGEIDGLVLKRVEQAGGTGGPAGPLFEVSWREAGGDVSAGGGVSAGQADPGAGWWLLLADSGGVAERLGEGLRARGGNCVIVRPGPGRRRISDLEHEISPAARAEFAALLPELRGLEPATCLGVVHAWNLDASLPEAGLPEAGLPEAGLPEAGLPGALGRAEDLGCGSVLSLVQELAGGALGEFPRLAILTRGAQRVAGDQPGSAVAQGAVWGLARVIAAEHGELRPVIIDLDPGQPADEDGQVLAELIRAGRDDQVCLRAGKRYLPRLDRWSAPPAGAATAAARPFDQARDGNFRIMSARKGLLDGLRPAVCERSAPGPGEIEIEVSAAGLNFSDVLKVMDLYPGLEPGAIPLGAECAGRVIAVGPGGGGHQVGDMVMAIAPASFAAFARTTEHLAALVPDSLSPEQAAASPVAFLTAIHCLEHLARLQAGESVLIHSATGGVGLAALQVARRSGAEIYATAGTGQKRELLRSLGVRHVLDSRSLRFADEIMEATAGRGVDVVLNSLAGEALTRGVSVLASGGRFVEIGKQDIYANSHLGLERLSRNRSFFAVDMERCFAEQPGHVARLFERLASALSAGEFTALPVTEFGFADAEAACAMMARAGHTGKIVLRRTGAETVTTPADQVAVSRDGSYLITGGLGALGLETALLLADLGARNLVLMGRTLPPARAEQVLDLLRSSTATVTLVQGDVSRPEDISRVMTLIDRELPPLRGVVHAAGILDDGLLAHLDQRRLKSVLAPKLAGGWHLHQATKDRELDFFLLYSSAAALLGSPAQGNYAAANAFLDSLAAYRQALGLPAQSISWGPWSGAGLAATADRGGRLAGVGIASITPQAGIAALRTILPAASPHVVVLPLDHERLRDAAAEGLAPRLLSDLVEDPEPAADRGMPQIRGALLAVPPGRGRREVLSRHIRLTIAGVLGMDPGRVETDVPLASLGFDSLMSLQLRKQLETTLGIDLPATLAWRYPTVEAIIPFLGERMGIPLLNEDRVTAASGDLAARGPASRDQEVMPDPDPGELPDLEIEAALLAKVREIEARL